MIHKIVKVFTIFCFLLIQVSCQPVSPEPSRTRTDVTPSSSSGFNSYDVGGFKDARTYETFAHKMSRRSAVRVQIEYGDMSVYGSGTYIKWRGHDMVVTAAHLFAFGGATVLKDEAIITSPSEKVFGKLVYIDKIVDIAVFAVPALKSRSPNKFNRANSFRIGEKLIYSGFPGPNQLLTFEGEMSGDAYGTDIAMSSFAWPGSSGSGVYNSKGELVGVVVSIMVGSNGNSGRQLIGSVVYIAPATLIDSVYLLYNLDKARNSKNAGF